MKTTRNQLRTLVESLCLEGQDMTSDASRAILSDIKKMFSELRKNAWHAHQGKGSFDDLYISLQTVERDVLNYVDELIYELEGDI